MAKVTRIADRRKKAQPAGKTATTQAPRLLNGDCRVRDYGRLPPEVKEGLRAIARSEGKSMSWVKEEIIIDWFNLPKPDYKTYPKAGVKGRREQRRQR
jgi:hypothetical protein